MRNLGFGTIGHINNRRSYQDDMKELSTYAKELRNYILTNHPIVNDWTLYCGSDAIEITNEKYPKVNIYMTPLFDGYRKIMWNMSYEGDLKECNSTSFSPTMDLKEDTDQYLYFIKRYLKKIQYWIDNDKISTVDLKF